jgi:ABC-type nitrate/sulfonate/bicarbonate transport system substrate-binding protein
MITRRRFVSGLATSGMAGLLGWRPELAAAEPPPETRKLRLAHFGSICVAPQYVAEELLKIEGFTEVQHVKVPGPAEISRALATGAADVNLHFAAPLIIELDAGAPLVLLAGVHIGCFEMFGADRVRAVRDLKGKTVAVTQLGLTQQPGVRPEAPGGDQAGAPRDPESGRRLRPRTGARRPSHRGQGVHAALRLCPPDDEGCSL